MTLVINFYGGPGTGKSTNSTLLFSKMKNLGINAEYVSEYVKQWAWENRKPVNLDQFYFFGKQARREYSLFENVDVIVTDSPVYLSPYYAHLFGTKEQDETFRVMSQCYYNMVEKAGNTYIHIWLKRLKPYNPKGRFQNEEEARKIDIGMQKFLTKELSVDLQCFDGSENGVEEILKMILERHSEKLKITV